MRPYHYVVLLFAAALAAGIILSAAWWMYILVIFLFLDVMTAGVIFIRLNFFLKAVHQGKSTTDIALTFDDGPADFTEAVLDVLRKESVPAAFFTIGARAAAHPRVVRRWDAEGHIIGNHSYHHGFLFDMLPASKMAAEMERANKVVAEITGKKPLLFRPPYGVTNPALARAVARTGMTAVGWSLRSFDTMAKGADALVDKIIAQLKGGDVILLHDSMQVTADALTSLIKTARAKGFTFVRLDTLLNIQPYA